MNFPVSLPGIKNILALDSISELVPAGGEETLTFGSETKYTQK